MWSYHYLFVSQVLASCFVKRVLQVFVALKKDPKCLLYGLINFIISICKGKVPGIGTEQTRTLPSLLLLVRHL